MARMTTQISKTPLGSHWNDECTPKMTKIIKIPQKSQNVQIPPPPPPKNLLIDQNRLKIYKTTKSTWKPLKWPKLPRKRLEWAVKSPKYPFGIIGMVNILQPKLGIDSTWATKFQSWFYLYFFFAVYRKKNYKHITECLKLKI